MGAELMHGALTASAVAAGWTGPNRLFDAAAPGGEVAPQDVSPGVIGFLVTLVLVLACIPLFLSMTGKLRGVQHRSMTESDPAGSDPAGSDPAGSDPAGSDPAGSDPAGSDPAGSDPAAGTAAPSSSPAAPNPSGEQTG